MTTVIVLSRRVVVAVAVAVAVAVTVLALALLPEQRGALAGAVWPRTTAGPATMEQQRAAAEASLQRGYLRAIGQLRDVRELRLAIPNVEADAIEARAREQLASIRAQALAAVGRGLGLGGPGLEQYVATAVSRLDPAEPAQTPVLLAPELFEIARQADRLFQQIADEATRQLTRAPSSSPSPSAAVPSAAPVPTAPARPPAPTPTRP